MPWKDTLQRTKAKSGWEWISKLLCDIPQGYRRTKSKAGWEWIFKSVMWYPTRPSKDTLQRTKAKTGWEWISKSVIWYPTRPPKDTLSVIIYCLPTHSKFFKILINLSFNLCLFILLFNLYLFLLIIIFILFAHVWIDGLIIACSDMQ